MSHTFFGKRVFSHVVAEYEVMYMLHGDRPIRMSHDYDVIITYV